MEVAGEFWKMHKAHAGIWVPWTLALPWNCMASVFLWGHHQHQNREGSRVKVMETRPISRDKRWRVVEIIEKAK